MKKHQKLIHGFHVYRAKNQNDIAKFRHSKSRLVVKRLSIFIKHFAQIFTSFSKAPRSGIAFVPWTI